MLNIPALLASELSVEVWQVKNTIALFEEGNTVPFVARYRKERTGGLDEVALRSLNDRYKYLNELEERKQTILKSIEDQGKLTDELKESISECTQKSELEDLYLPYKPRRRTRATKAKEKGLESLAEWIKRQNVPGKLSRSLEEAAQDYVDPEKGVETVEEALQGAADIIAEEIAVRADSRAYVRDYILNSSFIVSQIKKEYEEGTTQYENYRDFKISAKKIPAHNMLALRRGETEGFLSFDMEFDEAYILNFLELKEINADDASLQAFYHALIEDAFQRLMRNTLVGEVRLHLKEKADLESIKTFASNLRELLLASPAGLRPTLGIDPGFRTGCKLAVLDRTGKFLTYTPIFPHSGAMQQEKARETILELISTYDIELIAIGNGTAGRETDKFITHAIADLEKKPTKVLVNEAGASVYSASALAVEEFPDLDVTVRGAISIGRRLQDPLAELVKIDPKSIGVGQYQHDVDQTLLKQKLEETVESCVNFVGVNLNTASKELLQFTAGISPAVAKNIVSFREENGAFQRREQLLDVPRFGAKTYEQAAGFLRIPDGLNPLDNTSVHPERYDVVKMMSRDLNVDLNAITKVPDRLKDLRLNKYVREDLGLPTLQDILEELKKPGRDPRSSFTYATFRDDVNDINDLRVGMILEGSVTNVTNFGAFVDIGVHRDGLVHISQLADEYVNDPTDIVRVGQVVKVKVVEVNKKLNRIGLSMRLEDRPKQKRSKNRSSGGKNTPQKKQATLDDLVKKFNAR